ncbi:MAG TPA: hypothetical protein VJ965_01495 [Anaerolineales bacterium]|nr:hypothetical protein [Anaerolineales bacterium]
MADILITITDDGIAVEGEGFQGSGCAAEVGKAASKLGVQGPMEKKPEYHQQRRRASAQEQQKLGGR